MNDSLAQTLDTMTTDRSSNKEKEGSHSSHSSHDASVDDHATRTVVSEGEPVAHDSELLPAADVENRKKNGQEKDDKKVTNFLIRGTREEGREVREATFYTLETVRKA